MRKQTRLPEPEALAAKKQSGTGSWLKRRNAWRTSLAEGQSVGAPVFTWPHWNNASIYQHLLPVLKTQTDAHCSFCDAYPVAGVSTETIEHFYPKTLEEFEHRVLEWANLFYACNGCQNAKGSKFHPALLKPDDPDSTNMADPGIGSRLDVTLSAPATAN